MLFRKWIELSSLFLFAASATIIVVTFAKHQDKKRSTIITTQGQCTQYSAVKPSDAMTGWAADHSNSYLISWPADNVEHKDYLDCTVTDSDGIHECQWRTLTELLHEKARRSLRKLQEKFKSHN